MFQPKFNGNVHLANLSLAMFFSPSHELILAFYSVIMQYNGDFTIPRRDNVKTA